MIFWKNDFADTEKIHASVKKAYGINNPQNIQGYGGYFGFSFGKIYIDEHISNALEFESGLEGELNACLERFRALDYGDMATDSEKELNTENRLFFGLNCGLTGRYGTRYGTLEIKIPEACVTEIKLSRNPDALA